VIWKYITTTYTTASENIVINGLPPSPTFLASLLDSSPTSTTHQSEEYEPLDGRLHSRAAELYRKEEDLLEEIAALKREVPLQAAANWREALKGGIEQDEEAFRNAERANDVQDMKLNVGKRERQEEVERTWGRGIEGLGRLKREMPGTTARMERAKRVADYVLAEGKGGNV
jgi:kinetochor protein Mis14/NSL1